MKKLIAILMLTLMAVFAFAGGWMNIFNGTYLTVGTIDDEIRIPCWDETNGNRVELEMSVLDAYYAAKYSVVVLDTNNVMEYSKADDASTYSIDVDLGQIFLLDWLLVESGFDNAEYLGIYNADSNGTRLDSINLGATTCLGRRTNTYYFIPTQDTTLYFVWGDTCTVSKTVTIRPIVIDK